MTVFKTLKMIVLIALLFICVRWTEGFDVQCNPKVPLLVDLSRFPSGNIYSPGYLKGENYPSEIQCQLHLQSPADHHVRVKFNSMDIEISPTCKSDFLALLEMTSDGNQLLRGRFCGNSSINDVMSISNTIIVVFGTDYMRTARGFNLSFERSDTESLCGSGEFQCKNRNCIGNIRDRLCNGQDDCGDGTDEEDCGLPVLNPQTCGTPEVDPLLGSVLIDRIVGGIEARRGSWPWQVDMQLKGLEPNGHFCGGTLINAQWFVTAAHCFLNTRIASQNRIHLGNHHKYEKDPNEVIRYVKDYFIYGVNKRDFIRDGEFDLNHDIAVVKLNAPVKFNSHIQPACLPPQNKELHLRTNCIATGWGESRGTSGDDVLKQAEHPIQKETACNTPYQAFNNKTMICAGRLDAKFGLCHGDSGGPLICKENDRWTVYGVASFVTETNMIGGVCGIENKPTVFNKISQKIDYIKSIISNNS